MKYSRYIPSRPHPMYKGQMPIASRAAIKVLSRVSRRTNENMPSNISMNSSPYSSYCVKATLKGINARINRLMMEDDASVKTIKSLTKATSL